MSKFWEAFYLMRKLVNDDESRTQDNLTANLTFVANFSAHKMKSLIFIPSRSNLCMGHIECKK